MFMANTHGSLSPSPSPPLSLYHTIAYMYNNDDFLNQAVHYSEFVYFQPQQKRSNNILNV